MDEWEVLGTVTVLKQRIYPIDPTSNHPLRTEVVVEPGVFSVWRHYDTVRWYMRGRISGRNEKIGDGLFVMGGGDKPGGPQVEFPSMIYGLEQFAEFLNDPICEDGPDQRLRFAVRLPNRVT